MKYSEVKAAIKELKRRKEKGRLEWTLDRALKTACGEDSGFEPNAYGLGLSIYVSGLDKTNSIILPAILLVKLIQRELNKNERG